MKCIGILPRKVGFAQRAQYPLIIRKYGLNHNMKPNIIKPYSLIKGYWALWVDYSDQRSRLGGGGGGGRLRYGWGFRGFKAPGV